MSLALSVPKMSFLGLTWEAHLFPVPNGVSEVLPLGILMRLELPGT